MRIERSTSDVIKRIFEIHDVDVNQKYADILPYSFHLQNVINFVKKFRSVWDLVSKDEISGESLHLDNALIAAAGHDLIEDARMTPNDVSNLVSSTPRYVNGKIVTEMIYYCTELRGWNRAERHGKEYLEGLKHHKLANFIKVCDICANLTFSLATNSSMLKKYKSEWDHFVKETYDEDLEVIYFFIENILTGLVYE